MSSTVLVPNMLTAMMRSYTVGPRIARSKAIAMLKFSAYGDLSIASHEDEGDI